MLPLFYGRSFGKRNIVQDENILLCKSSAYANDDGFNQFESHVKFLGSGALSAGGIVLPLESVSAMLTSLGARFLASFLIGPLGPP